MKPITPLHHQRDDEAAPLLDIEDVSVRLNITVRHVRRLVAERRIPYLKVGHLVRFDPNEIRAWTTSLAVVSTIADPLRPDRSSRRARR